MGAGASVSEDKTVQITNVIAVVSGDKNDARLSALKELTKFCDQDDYKMPLIEQGKLLPLLVKILTETGEISEDQTETAKCCWYLSRSQEAKFPIGSEKGMIPALVSIVKRSQGEARSAALSVFINCAKSPEAVDYLLDPVFGLLDVIAMVITTDTNEKNVSLAYMSLANITKASWMPDRIGEFLRLDLHVLALNVLKLLGSNPKAWKNRTRVPYYCISFLMYISVYPEAAVSLKSAGALEVLTPLLVLADCEEAIKAALIVTFLAGKDDIITGTSSFDRHARRFVGSAAQWWQWSSL